MIKLILIFLLSFNVLFALDGSSTKTDEVHKVKTHTDVQNTTTGESDYVSKFTKFSQTEKILTLCVGFIILLILYNSFLFFIHKDAVYLYFVLYILSVLYWELTQNVFHIFNTTSLRNIKLIYAF